jgi:haloalkane dehalogenase
MMIRLDCLTRPQSNLASRPGPWLGGLLFSLLCASQAGCMQMLPRMAPGADCEKSISAAFPFESKFVTVLGSRMHYVEKGAGKPILLLHGNPTSCYIWRNVIPALSRRGRVIALDLIGMGRSDKPELAYTFQDHIRYIDAFVEKMDLKDLVLVGHDWGGGVAFDYAARHDDNVRGVAFFEAIVRPMAWSDLNRIARYMFRNFRDDEAGRKLVIEDNYFVEKLLPMMAGRRLGDKEMAAYRKPFPTEKSRKPVWMWPRELPIDGQPERNAGQIGANFAAMQKATIPLLFLYGNPGAFYEEEMVQKVKKDLPRAKAVCVGGGYHYLQESQPTKLAESIAEWIGELDE